MRSGLIKKKNISLMIIGFLLFSSSLMAQGEEENKRKWGKHIIKFNSTKLINFSFPGIEFGYEHRYGRLSSQFSVAYLVDITKDLKVISYNGCNFKFEEKFFFKKQPPNNITRFYLSTEISYNYVEIYQTRQFLPIEYKQLDEYEQEQYAYTGNFNSQRQAIIANLKFGFQIIIKKIILEPCWGGGIGFHNVIYYDKLNPNDILFDQSHPLSLNHVINKEGFQVLPNFNFSFKIGITF